ncbi:calcium-binding protein [Nocardioides sp. MAHUQ-72]|uniref:calcium-binding protein n=1 Tax=unclassified Nocardioides TaxID=2615069 RepID=UPI003606469B
MSVRTIHVAGVVAVAAVGLVGPAPVRAADAPTCMGRTATIVGTPYADTLYGTPGDDVVWLGGTALEGQDHRYDIFHGDDGADLVCQGGLGGADVDAGDGHDEVHLDGSGGTGVLQVSGGSGDDRLVAPAGEGARLSGGPGSDVLVGGAGRDFLGGGEGDDDIRAGGGDDRVSEGPGSDSVDAGAGDDLVTYNENYNGDETGSFEDDLVPDPVVVDAVTGTVRSGPDVDSVTGNECWEGTSKADTMTGSAGPDCFDGGEGTGADTIDAGDGDDLVRIYAGTVTAGGGSDLVRADYLRSDYNEPPDAIRTSIAVDAGPGADHVYANGFQMAADGGRGADLLDLSELNRQDGSAVGWLVDSAEGLVAGTPREFQTTVDFSSFEAVMGSDYNDRFRGSASGDSFSGGSGEDRAKGGPGRDRLDGGRDRDVLEGGRGDDVLRGQRGRPDLADGGNGRDRCSAERREECEAGA